MSPVWTREDDAEGGVGALHLLAQQREGDVVHPRPAVLLGNGQAQEPLGAHLLVQAAVVLGVGVHLLDARQDLALGEGARGALHLALRIGQRKVDHQFSVGGREAGRQILDRCGPSDGRLRADDARDPLRAHHGRHPRRLPGPRRRAGRHPRHARLVLEPRARLGGAGPRRHPSAARLASAASSASTDAEPACPTGSSRTSCRRSSTASTTCAPCSMPSARSGSSSSAWRTAAALCSVFAATLPGADGRARPVVAAVDADRTWRSQRLDASRDVARGRGWGTVELAARDRSTARPRVAPAMRPSSSGSGAGPARRRPAQDAVAQWRARARHERRRHPARASTSRRWSLWRPGSALAGARTSPSASRTRRAIELPGEDHVLISRRLAAAAGRDGALHRAACAGPSPSWTESWPR